VLRGIDLGQSGDGRVDREVDGFGHGTAMASIMVARPGLLDITGLAPDAKILPIAVPLTGTTDAGRPDRLPEAIRYAAAHSAKIINMSLGGKRSPKRDHTPCSSDEQSAIYYAMRKGAIVIASVGNTGPTANTVEDPAVCLGVVAVGAADAAGRVAEFSGRQPYLTLVAPGVGIASLGRVPGTAYSGDGTSQATAVTSAAAALVWSAHPQLKAGEVVARILATLDGGRTTPSSLAGFGRLNAYRAVTGALPGDAGSGGATPATGTSNPVYEAADPFVSRAEALRTVRAKPPPPAAKGVVSAGTFEVGTHPRLTPAVITGISLAAAGAFLLLVLLAVGVRGRARRHRLVPAGGPPLGRPAERQWAAPPTGWATPADPVALQPRAAGPVARPRPRPRPRPEPEASAGPAQRPRPRPRPSPPPVARPRPRPAPQRWPS
jgi:hypothetical protein